jgi:hypothetical protein
LYHIQTEDSGVNHPHVITHLFADGGRIIASRKTGYAEHLGAKDLQTTVKRLMQDQHKALFIELRDCVYDDDAPSAAITPAAAPASDVNPRLSPSAQAVEAVRGGPPPVPRAAEPHRESQPRGAVAVPAPRFVGTPPPASMPQRSAFERSAVERSAVDIEALDRAADARLLESASSRSRVQPERRGAGRYQQSIPASPIRSARQKPEHSIFGGDALRGKSLDEVILSYLSDDTGEGER